MSSNSIKNNNLLLSSCFCGIFNQAIMTNVMAVLFVPFMALYDLTLSRFGLLIGINFASQLLADISLSLMIDKLKYKTTVQLSNIISFIGMGIFALSGFVPNSAWFVTLVIGTVIFSYGSGMLEVTLSPITDTIPDDFKSKKTAMSLMHSFYAWGQIACIIITSVSLKIFGYENWKYIIIFYMTIPVLCFFMFYNADIIQNREHSEKIDNKNAVKSPIFILCLIAIMFGGGAEVVMNQYISAYCELSLNLTKTAADLIGMTLFAFFLGLGRLLYGKFGDKFNIHNIMIAGSILSIVCYLTVSLSTIPMINVIAAVLTGLGVSLLWPGALSVAGECFPKAGAFIFSFLAVSGDVGCMLFPSLSGSIADNIGINRMFLLATALPIATCLSHIIIKIIRQKSQKTIINNNNSI